MKFNHILVAASLILAAGVMPAGAARAETVLYDGMTVVQGQQGFTESFYVSTPGTLTMTVTDIPWLDTVSNLTFFLSSSSGLLGTTQSDGSETINVQPGTIYAHWFGDAQGTYDLGVVGVNVQFQPNGTVVGLPASLLLMLSGLGLVFGWQRRIPVPA